MARVELGLAMELAMAGFMIYISRDIVTDSHMLMTIRIGRICNGAVKVQISIYFLCCPDPLIDFLAYAILFRR